MNGLDLRPLSLGEILDRTFSLYRRHFLLFLGISAIPHLLTLALSLLQILFLPSSAGIEMDGRAQTPLYPWGGSPQQVIVTVLTIGLSIFVYLLSQAGTVFAVSELYLGRTTSISAALRRYWGDLAVLFGVVVLNGVAIAGALILLVLPGIYVGCRLLVCVPSALIEGREPRESLSRSWDLTRGYTGRAFILSLLYAVLTAGVGLLIAAPLDLGIAAAGNDPAMLRAWLSVQQVLNVLVDSAVDPFILIGTSVFYFDLRVRKEAFDLQFMLDPTSERVAPGDGPAPSIRP